MHGVAYADMLALIRFVAPYSGYPSAAGALGRIAEIATELNIDTSSEPQRVAASSAGPVWPVADSWMADFIESRTKRAWSEEALTPRERAFVALTAHVSQRALADSFRHHVELALTVASPEEVRNAIRFTAEMGITETVAALDELETILGASGR
jgi:alkylhydroperoxidase/carboxymuconolactone decarboxylase family protein YurZ